ncbi:hypothetical protein TL16_g13053 [Triparma laevis f. inornata]|uniref:RING-CH-type domain-containing protein n=1 Tax=Triparma laevis f. inornata TaxID=1714386 RepID=A0A9W7BR78_9STRA|nr:hypothetical protein TL16_g13053 [Triparma laevis f. inornata]
MGSGALSSPMLNITTQAEAVQSYASLISSPPSSLPLPPRGLTISLKIYLRHPTHNIPDKFFGDFLVNSKKGCVVRGNKYRSIEGFCLRDVDSIYAPTTSNPALLNPSNLPPLPLNPPPHLPKYPPPPTFTLPETRALAFSLLESDSGVYLVPSGRFHLYYSGITHLVGDTYNSSRVHRIEVGDVLKFGSASLIVKEIDRGEGKEKIDPELCEMVFRAFDKSSSTSSSNATPPTPTASSTSPPLPENGGGEIDADAMCYVCTDNSDTDGDPLVSPCNCKGGTKSIHISCLRQWVIKDKDEGICKVTSPGGENCYDCSVCKSPYRYEVFRKGKKVEIFDRSVKVRNKINAELHVNVMH